MKTSIYQQHQEHTEWLNKLSFYKDEIALMQKRIDELSARNTARELSVTLSHFQNQLDIQSNNIRDLVHHINREEKVLEHDIKSNPVAVDHRKAEDHKPERDMVEGFEKNFNNLRHELNGFVAKWL